MSDFNKINTKLNQSVGDDLNEAVRQIITTVTNAVTPRGGQRFDEDKYVNRNLTGNIEEALDEVYQNDLEGFIREVKAEVGDLQDALRDATSHCDEVLEMLDNFYQKL